MNNWASPVLVVQKKAERAAPTVAQSSMNNLAKHKKEFILRLGINCRKLNSCIVTARHINVDGSIEKIITNYLLPTIDNLLVRFQGCKYFSTMD